MNKALKITLMASAVCMSLLALSGNSAQAASSLSTVMFQDTTGLKYNEQEIQSTWDALKTMGTDQFLGGMIGSFKLDEASMIAGALTIGATEFDNFLRSGSLNTAISGIGDLLSKNMSQAAGANLSSLTGSFTQGGGASTNQAFDVTSASALGGEEVCDPAVANDLVQIGKKHVEMMRSAALEGDYSVSKISDMAGASGTGTGFASLGCLDKLFQNAGSDILFKPPSLGTLMSQLQNWTCPKIPGVADQVMGGFGDLSMFDTQSMGGFFPDMVFGEANDGPVSPKPGLGNDVKKVFGADFGSAGIVSDTKIAEITDLKKLFQ